MENQNPLKLWSYQLIYHIPVASSSDGDISWKEVREDRTISLPSDVVDPAGFVQESCSHNFAELLEFRDFQPSSQVNQ